MSFLRAVSAADLNYPRDVSKWIEVKVPSDSKERVVWSYAAGYSKNEWTVFAEGSRICAQLDSEKRKGQATKPSFIPKAERYREAPAVLAVDNGWLVGFNQGEWGGALYWFSRDGRQNYKISNDQIVDFFRVRDGIYAVQGLAHMGLRIGSVIRITQPTTRTHWRAATVVKLPFAPYAVSVCKDGAALLTLSDSVVSLGRDGKLRTILPEAPWSGLYPSASALSADGQMLYIGMRQFVGELDLRTKRLRLLVPSRRFLNKLSEEDERTIRSYG